jgi:hypothetical protein
VRRVGVLWLCLGLLASIGASVAAGHGVTVALTPNMFQVPPGALFDLDLTITEAGSPFNGFNAVIGFDPAALTCMPRDPLSLQEGDLMRDACAVRFHRFEQGSATDTIGDFLLCNGVSVTGPGQIYHLQFRASQTPQVTTVRFLAGLHFYNEGTYVTPIHAADAVIGIGLPPAAVEPRVPPGGLRLRISPNPARRATTFSVGAELGGPQRITVADICGRVVWRSDDVCAGGGYRVLTWDGRDAGGKPLPSGIYFVKFGTSGRSVSDRMTWIR